MVMGLHTIAEEFGQRIYHVTFQDQIGHKKTVVFGGNPKATKDYDPALGEVLLPPRLPLPVLDEGFSDP